MYIIKSNSNNVYFNLALEEYLLKNFEIPFFLIYRNDDCVVAGKHQNIIAEINYRYIYENDILISRRISGGGTVFQDNGCLNFAYIKNMDKDKFINYKENLTYIVNFLKYSYNLNVFFDGKNSLYIENKKISGNSQHIYKNRLLHHGTLLFKTNIEKLMNSLSFINKNYIDKAVKSKPHQVVNISDYTNQSIEEFEKNLISFVKDYFKAEIFELTVEDINNINILVEKKYKTWDWIFGYSPFYIFCKNINYENENFQITIEVEKGIINNVYIKNLKNEYLENLLKKNLLQFPHDLAILSNNSFFKKNKELLYNLF